MRLFGERGYAATTVAQIEAAAGLSPGAGGLYAHFSSKEAVLRAGLEAILTPNPGLPLDTDPADSRVGAAHAPALTERLEEIARAGLVRLDHDRDFNRILVRDLRTVPDLLQLAADREIRPIHDRLAALLTRLASHPELDSQALAAVLIGATTHLWLLTDIYGAHPAGVTQEAYLQALVRCAAAALGPKTNSSMSDGNGPNQ